MYSDDRLEFPDVIHLDVNPRPYLGQVDAEVDWEEDRKPVKTFVHIKAYEEFKREDSLIVFGRKGTGKSAMIRMLNYEIQTKSVLPYFTSVIVDEKEAYDYMVQQIWGSPLADLPAPQLTSLLRDQWRWLITVTAMGAVVAKVDNSTFSKETRTIKQYLADVTDFDIDTCGFKTSPLRLLIEALSDELGKIDYVATKVGAALIRLANRLMTPGYKEACEALSKILKEKNAYCLVLVDSMELYAIYSKIVRCVTVALIDAVLECFQKRNETRILAKAALPTEIYNHIRISARGKVMGRILFIMWNYNDLLSFIAKRYFMYAEGSDETPPDSLDDSRSAREYIYRFLPPKISTRRGFRFDTFAYILRHTQRKPRQLLYIFNTILTLAEREGVNSNGKLTEEIVRNGVHAPLHELVEEAMSMYGEIYPVDVGKLIRVAFSQEKNIFDARTLKDFIKRTHGIRREGDMLMSNLDAERLFLDSGVVGVVTNQAEATSDERSVVKTVFEYQMRGTLSIKDNDWCAIHPMFNQELRLKVIPHKFVYPQPSEEEEEQLLESFGE